MSHRTTPHRAADGMQSLVSGLGMSEYDKSASVFYFDTPLSDQQLAAMYGTSWIARKLVDIPANDALRKWRDWSGAPDQVTAVWKTEKRLGLQKKMLECKIAARLWGGAAIFIGTGDADLSEPLDPDAVGLGGLKYLTVLPRTRLTSGDIETDPASELFDRPQHYQIATQSTYQPRIHPSRFVLQAGASRADAHLAGAYDGWGDSVLQCARDAIRNADSTAANIASLVFEANVDAFGVPGLMRGLAEPNYEKRLIERFRLSALAKSTTRAIVHDAEETYERKAVNFSQLPDVMEQFLLMVSGAADIPLTRFLGQSPAGMSSTGTGDMRNYHDKIQSVQTLEIGPAMSVLDDCIVRSALGERPDDVDYEWSPLEQMSEKEIAEIGDLSARTIVSLNTAGVFTVDELRKSATTLFDQTGALPGIAEVVRETDETAGFDLGGDDADAGPVVPDPTSPDLNALANDAAPRTLHVSRAVLNADAVLSWARDQGFTDLLPADDLHVTVMYSRTPCDWIAIGESWDDLVTVPRGGPRIVEKFDGGATVLQFASQLLEWRHERMKEAGAHPDYHPYQPHVTLTYGASPDLRTIEPYTGEIKLGPELFKEIR